MIEFQPIHVIGLAISFALFYQSVRLVRKGKESVFEFLLWVSFGLLLLILSIGNVVTVLDITDLLKDFLNSLGFGSGEIGLLVMSNLALMMMLFYTYINVKTNRKLIYDMNQEMALSEYKNNDD